MKKLISGACAAVMAVTSFSAAAVPATAASTLQFTSDAQFMNVQWRDRDRDRGGWERGRDRDRDGRRGFERRGDGVYWNGHRGSRDRRGGWQQRNGFWFPPEAFAGAIIGGIVSGAINSQNNNNNQRVVRITRQHLEWCENRFRSYRASDNTFQPYNGPRQQCISPYLR